MNATQAALTTAALVAVAGLVWWNLDGVTEPALEPKVAVASELTRGPVLEGTGAELSALDAMAGADPTDRASVAPAVREEEPQAAVSSAEVRYTGSVDARFVDERGVPRSGVRFSVCEDRHERTGTSPVVSGPDGRAQLEVPIPRIPVWKRDGDTREFVREWKFRFTAAIAGCATVERAATLRSGETTHLGDVILGPGGRVHGRVVDENGRGVGGATVGVAAVELPEDEGRMRRHGASAFSDASTVASSDDGTFVLDGVAMGVTRLWSKADGMRYSWSVPITVTPDREVFDVEVVLARMLATDRIDGRVIDPEGNPVRNASLFYIARAGASSTGTGLRADDGGRFGLVIEYDDSNYDFTANDGLQRFAQASALGVLPGTLDLVIRLNAKQFLDVRVVDADGHAVEGVKFMVSSRYYERDARAETTGDGHHRVEVPDDLSELRVSAYGWRTERRGPIDPQLLPRSLEIVLRRAPIVRGRVVADGGVVAGARVEARAVDPDASLTVDGFRCVMSSWSSGNAKTGEDGRFELVCDLDGACWIRVTAGEWVAGEIGPIDVARLGADASFDVVLTKGGAIEGHVLLSGGADAEGQIVAINHGDGLPRTTRAGPNGLFRFEGLSPGRWQVLARATEIDTASTHFSSTDDTEPIEWSCTVVAGSTTRYDLDLTAK